MRKLTLLLFTTFFINTIFAQIVEPQSKFYSNEPENSEYFGNFVVKNDKYIAIGARLDDNTNGQDAGAVYIYKIGKGELNFHQKIIAPNGNDNDKFGIELAIDDDFLFISAMAEDVNGFADQGAVYVYRLENDFWNFFQKINLSTNYSYACFGNCVDVYNNYAIIGAYKYEGGRAFLYKYTGTTWELIQTLSNTSGNGLSYFGADVAIYENKVMVSSQESFLKGAVYFYNINNDNFELVDEFRDVYVQESSQFGIHIDMNSEFGVVSAYKRDTLNFTNIGSVTMYKYDNEKWKLDTVVLPNDKMNNMKFGYICSINDENYVIVGAPGYNQDGESAGAAYLLRNKNNQWIENQIIIPESGTFLDAGDNFGYSTFIDSSSIFIGAYKDSDDYSEQGSMYYYHFDNQLASQPENKFVPELIVFPSPTNTFIKIKSIPGGDFLSFSNVEIYDLTGRKIYTLATKNNYIDVSTLENSIYFLSLTIDEKKYNLKFVKN